MYVYMIYIYVIHMHIYMHICVYITFLWFLSVAHGERCGKKVAPTCSWTPARRNTATPTFGNATRALLKAFVLGSVKANKNMYIYKSMMVSILYPSNIFEHKLLHAKKGARFINEPNHL